MAKITVDRVLETSTTTGTGALTLAGSVLGYRAFSAVCANADTTDYYAEGVSASGAPSGAWETGLGTWGTGGILTRTTLYSSSTGALISWPVGTVRIGMGLLASRVQSIEASIAAINGATFTAFAFAPSAGSTTLTVSYTVGYIMVEKNGALLAPADYTATSGTSITVPATLTGDTFTVYAFATISLTNAVLRTGDTMTGALVLPANATTALQAVPKQQLDAAVGAVGGGTDKVFFENDQTVNTNYTLTTNKNAISAGTVTIANGVTVTVPTGAIWSIV